MALEIFQDFNIAHLFTPWVKAGRAEDRGLISSNNDLGNWARNCWVASPIIVQHIYVRLGGQRAVEAVCVQWMSMSNRANTSRNLNVRRGPTSQNELPVLTSKQELNP